MWFSELLLVESRLKAKKSKAEPTVRYPVSGEWVASLMMPPENLTDSMIQNHLRIGNGKSSIVQQLHNAKKSMPTTDKKPQIVSAFTKLHTRK